MNEQSELRRPTGKELSLILSTIRRAWSRYPNRYAALNRARVSYGVYVCESCGEHTRKKNIDVDHIVPVVPVSGHDSIEGYIVRLFCQPEGLRILCKSCHKGKSTAENVVRLSVRRKKKSDE